LLPKNYSYLKPFAQETLLRGFFISIAVSKGLLPATPEYDDGIDLVLIDRKATPHESFLIQLKSRLTLDHKYYGKGYWIGFINNPTNTWYFLEYDKLEQLILECSNVKNTKNWINSKSHSSGQMSVKRQKLLEKYIFTYPI
jgi:hypothetical protein